MSRSSGASLMAALLVGLQTVAGVVLLLPVYAQMPLGAVMAKIGAFIALAA